MNCDAGLPSLRAAATAGLVWWALGRAPETSRFEALRNLIGTSAAAAPNPGDHP